MWISQFKECVIPWVKSFQLVMNVVIAIDGKCLRRSFDKAIQQSAMHMVSVFATSSKLVVKCLLTFPVSGINFFLG